MPVLSPNSVLPPYAVGVGLVYLLELDHSGIAQAIAHSDLGTVAGRAVGAFREFYSKAPPPGSSPPLSLFATEDYISGPTDTVAAHRWYDGRINRAGQVDRSVSLTAVDGPSYGVTYATVELANGDGALDDLPDITTLANSHGRIKVGLRGASLSQFQTLMTGIVMGVDVGLETATIYFGGLESLLDRPWWDAAYLGTGNTNAAIEGPAALQGQPKPCIIGTVFNTSPVLVEPVTYIFQVHADGPLTSIDGVGFGGVTFPPSDGDDPNYTTLLARTVPIGHYATCLAQGLIKVGLTAAGADGSFSLTVSATAAPTPASTGEAAQMVADRALADLNVGFDAAAFAQMLLEDGHAYGRLLTEPVTFADVLSDIMVAMNRYWGTNREGLLTTGKLRLPASATDSGLAWDTADLIEVDRMALPDGFAYPHNQRTVKLRKNWAPQTNLAAIVTDQSYSTEYLTDTYALASPLPNGVVPPVVDTNLRAHAGAIALATTLVDLHGGSRVMFSAKASILSGAPSVLESINLTYPRFGLSGGQQLTVVASTEDYDEGSVLLTLWGN